MAMLVIPNIARLSQWGASLEVLRIRNTSRLSEPGEFSAFLEKMAEEIQELPPVPEEREEPEPEPEPEPPRAPEPEPPKRARKPKAEPAPPPPPEPEPRRGRGRPKKPDSELKRPRAPPRTRVEAPAPVAPRKRVEAPVAPAERDPSPEQDSRASQEQLWRLARLFGSRLADIQQEAKHVRREKTRTLFRNSLLA